MMNSSLKKQQGAVLIVVLLLLVIMMILAISLSSNSSTHAKIANNSILKSQAFQMAESGSDVILSYLIENSGTGLDKLKSKTCDNTFENQFKLDSSGLNTITSSSDSSKRKYQLSWYACFPKGEVEQDCDDGGKCFQVIITGRACMMNGGSVDADSCVVSRHLQGYQMWPQQ